MRDTAEIEMGGLRIIPTRMRQKISRHDSYPIGAESISSALAETSQISQLVLHFKPEYGRKDNARTYRFLLVLYSSRYAEMKSLHLDKDGNPLFNEWQIEVFSVPRVLRHRIQQYILIIALPEIRAWLDKRQNIKQHGSESLSFFYDRVTDDCAFEDVSALQPAWLGA